jgi:hypothetical protein
LTIHYAVTYEFEHRPPLTYRGTATAGKVSTCARLALNEAQKALKPHGWASLNFVVLERTLEASTEEDTLEEDPA